MAAIETHEIDFAGRFADKLAPSSARGTWQEREQGISEEIAAGPDETVAGFAWHFNDLYTRNIKSLLASGDFAQAKRYYDEVRGAIEENRDHLLSISQVSDTGAIADELAARAHHILMGSFNQERVQLSDGSEVTVGQALADGSPFLDERTEELQRLNFSDAATQLYMSNDRNIKMLMDPFLRTVRGGAGRGGVDQLPNRIQMQELAEAYAADAGRIDSIFGDGTARLLDYVRETHKTSGNGAATLKTLVDFAESYSASTGRTGRELASEVVNGYNDLVTAVFRDDTSHVRNGKAPPPQEVTDEQRRVFDAAFLPAVRTALDRMNGDGFDLHDVSLRQSMREIADVVAYTSALGGDLFGAARGAGAALNSMFGDYVAEAMTGQAHMPDNIVTAIRGVRGQLSSRLTGGRDASTLVTELTGNDRDYLANLDKINASRSSCPEADGLAADAHSFLARGIISGLARGESFGTAFARIADDPDTINGLAARFARSFHGRGREEVAMALAGLVTSGLASGDQVSIERALGDLCFGRASAGLSSDALTTARTWYHGNVASQLRFAQQKTALRDKYRAEGYSDFQARRAVAAVSEAASRAEAAGKNPLDVYEKAMDVGTFYTYEFIEAPSGTGQKGADSKPQMRLTRHIGPRSAATVLYGRDVTLKPGSFRDDRAQWDAVQAQLAEIYERESGMTSDIARQRQYLELKKQYKDAEADDDF